MAAEFKQCDNIGPRPRSTLLDSLEPAAQLNKNATTTFIYINKIRQVKTLKLKRFPTEALFQT